jgi:hypothetical protein
MTTARDTFVEGNTNAGNMCPFRIGGSHNTTTDPEAIAGVPVVEDRAARSVTFEQEHKTQCQVDFAVHFTINSKHSTGS